MGGLEAERLRSALKTRLFGEPMAPLVVGRFEVLSKIGNGGMGVVYAAHDPKLDRRVALKLLHDGGENEKLYQEARAMARLEHPNVVGVYDVGTFRGRVFVAMEYVEGDTLRGWLGGGPSIESVVAAFERAARGLAAAHRAGLVHRDFKPENVLVSATGEVRVADFGLARAARPRDGEASPESQAPASKTGLAGTPIYMAPELFRGEAANAASDQWAFAVSLYEGLVGRAPFQGVSIEDLKRAHATGAPPIDTLGVPRRVKRAVARGLAVEPELRFPSLDAFAEELRVAPRRDLALIGVFGLTIVLASGAVLSQRREAEEIVCRDDTKLQAVWGPSQREAVRGALTANQAPYAADAAARTLTAIDDYAAALARESRDACQATRERRQFSSEVMDMRMACVARRQQELGALVDVLSKADSKVLEGATDAVAKLSKARDCSDVDNLLRKTPLPSDEGARAQVVEAETLLTRAQAKRNAGQLEEAMKETEAALRVADTSGFGPVRAEVLTEIGRLQSALGKPKDATETLLSAVDLAEASRADELAASAWVAMVAANGRSVPPPAETLKLARRAEAAISRLGGSDSLSCELETVVGRSLREADELEGARLHFERAIALAKKAYGEDAFEVAQPLSMLAATLTFMDRHAEAVPLFERAISLTEDVLGPDHPRIAAMLNGYGVNLKQRGKYREAADLQMRALAVLERALGKDHPDLAPALINLGSTLSHMHLFDEARSAHARALEIREKSLGKEHPLVALAINNLANVEIQQKRFDKAKVLHEQALAIRIKALGPDHRMTGMSYTNLGDVAAGQKSYQSALENYRKALSIFEHAQGVEHSWLAYPLTGMGAALVELGRADDAVAPLERALEIRQKVGIAADLAAETRFALGRALWKKDEKRARVVLAEARAAFVAHGDRKADVADVDAFVAGKSR